MLFRGGHKYGPLEKGSGQLQDKGTSNRPQNNCVLLPHMVAHMEHAADKYILFLTLQLRIKVALSREKEEKLRNRFRLCSPESGGLLSGS